MINKNSITLIFCFIAQSCLAMQTPQNPLERALELVICAIEIRINVTNNREADNLVFELEETASIILKKLNRIEIERFIQTLQEHTLEADKAIAQALKLKIAHHNLPPRSQINRKSLSN